MTHAARVCPFALVAAFAAAVAAVGAWVVAHPEFASRPGLLGGAVTLDLVVGVPVVAYLVLVRRGRVRPAHVLPFALLGVLLARLIVPEAGRGLLHRLEWAVIAAELALVVLVGVRLRRGIRAYRRLRTRVPFAIDALTGAVADALGSRLAARFVAAELGVLGGALVGPWRRPVPPDGADVVASTHRAGSYPVILGTLTALGLVEIAVVHVALAGWSEPAAWIATALGAYGVVWILGDFQAMRHAPLAVIGDRLEVAIGFRWRASIPLADVVAVRTTAPPDPAPDAPGDARPRSVAGPSGPDLWIETSRPVELRGPFGIERRTRHLGLPVDDPARLGDALDHMLRRYCPPTS